MQCSVQTLEKVSKGAKVRSRYNKVPHLAQDTNGKVTNSQLDTTNESQEVSPFPAGVHKAHINRRAQRHSKHKTEQKHKRSKHKTEQKHKRSNPILTKIIETYLNLNGKKCRILDTRSKLQITIDCSVLLSQESILNKRLKIQDLSSL